MSELSLHYGSLQGVGSLKDEPVAEQLLSFLRERLAQLALVAKVRQDLPVGLCQFFRDVLGRVADPFECFLKDDPSQVSQLLLILSFCGCELLPEIVFTHLA